MGSIPGLGRSPGGGQPTPVFLPGKFHGHEPGRLQSIGLQRVGQDWRNLARTHIPVKPPTSLRSWTEPTPLNVSSLPLYYHHYYCSCMWWERLTHAVPSGGSDGKESACSARDLIPGSGRSPGEGHGNPLLYSCLENPMDRGAWWATVHGVAKSWTRLSNCHFLFHFHHPLKR